MADYKVGYGKPPSVHQFKPGVSGNPRGRPKKKDLDLNTALLRELDRTIKLTENGRTRRVTKRELLAKQMIGRAIKGNAAEAKLVLQQVHEAEAAYAAKRDELNERTLHEAVQTAMEIMNKFKKKKARAGQADAEPREDGS